MRVMNALVLDEMITGTNNLYTDPKWNAMLGYPDQLSIWVIADTISGTSPTVSVQIEHSADNRNFNSKNGTAEINGQTLTAGTTQNFVGTDAGTTPNAGFVRLKIFLGGTTPNAHLRIWVTGRGQQAA